MSSRVLGYSTAGIAVLMLWTACVKDTGTRSTQRAPMIALTEQICSDCHEVKKLDRVEALLMVSAERMPPPEVGLDDTMRSRVIRELCTLEYGATDAECPQRYLRPHVRLAIPIPVFAARINLANSDGAADKPGNEKESALRGYVSTYARPAEPVYYEPTLEAFRLVAAYLRCHRAPKPDSCIQAILAPSIEVDDRGRVAP